MNTHIINKQIIELKVFSEEQAFGLQQQARDAYMSDVLPLISEVLDDLAGPDEVLRIDRLEVDFGMLDSGKMADQMKARIREALIKQLPKFNRNTGNKEKQSFTLSENAVNGKKNTAQLMSESFSQRELLAIYFESGFLPWWAPDEIDAPDIDEIIISLFEKEPVTTMQWLQQLVIKSPQALKRVLLQLEKTTHKFILATIPGKVISTLQSLSKQLQVVNGNRIPLPFLQGEAANELLLFVLLLPGEIFHAGTSATKEILGTLIKQLPIVSRAFHPGFEKQLYANTLSQVISSGDKAAAPDLVEYFVTWEKEHAEAAASVTGNVLPVLEIFTGNDELSISELADKIERTLMEFEERQPFERRLKKAAAKGKKQHKRKLNNKVKKNAVVSQEEMQDQQDDAISIDTTANDLTAPVKLPVKAADAAIETLQENETGSVKINWFKAKDENSIPEKISGKIGTEEEKKSPPKDIIGKELGEKIISTEEAKSGNENPGNEDQNIPQHPTPETPNPEPGAPTPEPPVEQEKPAPTPEDQLFREKPSAGMTRFGGLVILAPFLPAFFSELKLVEDGKFTGEAEQYKAVHLLNFLATGKTSSPEYKLLLHKLLCGIEITQPIPKTIKLTAAEKKEAMLFLDDIAGQWTTLRSTSGKALRDTFFRRNGILEKRDNSWLLRVERGGMDIILDTLPWTISIIKAPWMQQLLQVEW